METKICGRCKIEQSIEFFGKDKNRKCGYRPTCNDCRKIESKKYRENNKERRAKTIKDYYDKNKEIIAIKGKIRYYDDVEKTREVKLKSYHKNKDKESNIQRIKNYRKENRPKLNEWEKNKRQTDPIYKLTSTVRSRLKSFLRKNNITKKNKTFELVGCTPQELKEHLEKQFREGMTWDNHGMYGWHIDHIIPLSSATTEEELYKLCHYTNLQPLWAEENLSKGNKVL
jgi:hypothetical protein